MFKNVGETEYAESQALVLNVLQEALCNQFLRMLLVIVELRVAILALRYISAVLLFIKVELVLNKYIFAEVLRQIFGSCDLHHVVNAPVQ